MGEERGNKVSPASICGDRDIAVNCDRLVIFMLLQNGFKLGMKYKTAESVRRSDVIREVVRTHKLNLDDSIIVADCIVKGLYLAGKAVVLA